ncbi:GNAT family N-acetyltransferase [Caenimonas koreensis DSM 17982]|uniref:GNAT family N-acetyltransferase n=1 Tax=Caenimonas koreensis DSM 17982 TaxID=1121255 RepID=A0A844AXG6_9BURK|nr:GNAT family N-acetyltransferase [Caenimonas koreensis]MRD47078.1 GNAT family N-acetyltransferase [Caenimonas koreensis DSM 17982]
MSTALSARDGWGPEWAAAVADVASRAAAVFSSAGVPGCLTVVDMQSCRLLDAWWLRRCLEPLARLSGRPLRYVPCGDGRHAQPTAPAWSVGTAPMELCWPQGSSVPLNRVSGQAWLPDGPVLLLTGDAAQRLPQELLLAHHGQMSEWAGEPGAKAWQPMDAARHCAWITQSIEAYASCLPSAMLSLPIGYWRFAAQALAWAPHGCLMVARAEGWSSIADMRETTIDRIDVNGDAPPVNFHWLAQQAPRLGASAHTIRHRRDTVVQLMVGGLPDAQAALPLLGAPLAAAVRSPRADRVRAVRALALAGDLPAALSVMELATHDPAMLRSAWDVLAARAASASPAVAARLGMWLEHAMADNPWFGEDQVLLRAAGHVALACARIDLAQTVLRALDDLGGAVASDLAALARCLEQLGCFEAALGACDRAIALDAKHTQSAVLRARITVRIAALVGPWGMQHEHPVAPLLLDPLHADHAPMLVRQMRDPSIPSMTALPPLTPGEDGRAWIEGRLKDGPASFAIVHRQLGFVGYIDLRLWQSTAFVCYWIGPDFQGLGLCAPALALACDLAARNGVELLLSSAYDDNLRSLRVLRKNGFEAMTVRALAPDHDRTFVMLPVAAPMTQVEAEKRLADFCENTGSGLRFGAAQAGATDTATQDTKED